MADFTTLTWVIIAIIIAGYVFNEILGYLNKKKMSTEIPETLKGIYDEEEYAKQQRYTKAKSKLESITSSIDNVLILLMIIFGGFAILNNLSFSWFTNPIAVSLCFFGILYAASSIIGLPFEYYNTFGIEEIFGFNKSTKSLFAKDQVKSFILECVMMGLLLAAIEFIYMKTGGYFWILAWAVVAAFSIFISMFYTSLIVPLFNKQTPLEEGELRTQIENFSKSVGFKLDNIYVMDSSKRSTKANAYFSGLGPKKRIVLFDTLINELTTEEIVAVLSHEIGHYKKKHTLQGMAMGLATTLITFALLGLFLNSDALAQAFGVETHNFHINILVFGLIYSPLSIATSILSNMLSRRNEYQADNFAAAHGQGEFLISALKKISVKSLSNLNPHPFYVFCTYSHPTLLQRIEAIKKAVNK